MFSQARLAKIQQDVIEEEKRQKLEAERKKEQINQAEQRRHGPVDDAQMVDEIFDFIEDHGSSEGTAPSAFKVNWVICINWRHQIIVWFTTAATFRKSFL